MLLSYFCVICIYIFIYFYYFIYYFVYLLLFLLVHIHYLPIINSSLYHPGAKEIYIYIVPCLGRPFTKLLYFDLVKCQIDGGAKKILEKCLKIMRDLKKNCETL